MFFQINFVEPFNCTSKIIVCITNSIEIVICIYQKTILELLHIKSYIFSTTGWTKLHMIFYGVLYTDCTINSYMYDMYAIFMTDHILIKAVKLPLLSQNIMLLNYKMCLWNTDVPGWQHEVKGQSR